MASHAPVRLTAAEKLHLTLITVPRALVHVVLSFLRRLLTQWPPKFTSKALKRHLGASLTSLLPIITPRQMRALNPATSGDAVRAYCAAHSLPLESVRLEDPGAGFPPAVLHFVGCDARVPPKSAAIEIGDSVDQEKRRVLLYFHGGGYIAPLQNLKFAVREAKAARAGLAVLEYTLAPECQYPGQLAQAAAALRYLLAEGGRSYSDVVVGGESGGGNLALALLAHLQSPKPGIAALPPGAVVDRDGADGSDSSTRLRAVVAVSPRTRNDATASSYNSNAWKDSMGRASLAAIAANWAPAEEVWAAPDLADAGFWKGLRAEHVLLVAGDDEVYRDDIAHTAEVMRAAAAADDGRPTVRYVVCPGEIHVQCAMDIALGIEDGFMTREVMSWLGSLPPP